MVNILAVCTGNICRSPLTELLLAARFAGVGVRVTSAGTRARDGLRVTAPTAEIARAHGASPDQIDAHVSRLLKEEHLESTDLVLAMAREHRREVVELSPSHVRRTFTLREFRRFTDSITDQSLREAASQTSPSAGPQERLSLLIDLVASRRGLVPPPDSPEDDDILDPYGRSDRTYELSASQLTAALPAVERLLRVAIE